MQASPIKQCRRCEKEIKGFGKYCYSCSKMKIVKEDQEVYEFSTPLKETFICGDKGDDCL